MTEQQRPDEDVEGHFRRTQEDAEAVNEDDVEGHKHMLEEGSADDVAGHGRARLGDEDDDDVAGHGGRTRN